MLVAGSDVIQKKLLNIIKLCFAQYKTTPTIWENVFWCKSANFQLGDQIFKG